MAPPRAIELMSPAGSFESLHAAIQGGCDSVYFGIGNLNMRASASVNFKAEDIHEIARITRAAGVRSYLTLNTVLFDADLDAMRQILALAKDAGINAVIAADQAVITRAAEIGLEIHLSTQLNITNFEMLKFYSQFADVAVLARECTLEQMTAICDQIREHDLRGPSGRLMQIEVFVHGALCMSISGKCHLSLHTRNKSANRGECLQNCRRRYRVTDAEHGHELEIDNEYIMSPKDLCTIGFLDRVIATGVSVLKIEGRGKSADYVKTVTRCYREAIDSVRDETYDAAKIADWTRRLESVFNRGFWGGYYLGKKLGEWTRSAGSEATLKKVYVGKCVNFYAKLGVGEFLLEGDGLRAGDAVLVMGPTTGVVEAEIQTLHIGDDGEKTSAAHKGDVCTFAVTDVIRRADKLYKLVPS